MMKAALLRVDATNEEFSEDQVMAIHDLVTEHYGELRSMMLELIANNDPGELFDKLYNRED